MEPTDGTAEVGEVIGDYRLERLLGAGATSRVFCGTHVRLRRRAAIKVLSEELAESRRTVQRLLDEARIVNDIRHPNIIDISDFVETEKPRRVALVMEYVEGPSLRSVIGRPIPSGQALGVALQLMSAIAAAHQAGVVHRDLKPDNLLLGFDPKDFPESVPTLKVADFGIAKIAGSALGMKPATGIMIGTPAYMAPEQIAGQPPPSAATDVYAIGEILFELLSGARAHPRSSVHEVIRSKLRGVVPDVVLPAAVPGGVELTEMIRRCLAREQKARPALHDVREAVMRACPEALLRLGAATWARPEPRPSLASPMTSADRQARAPSLELGDRATLDDGASLSERTAETTSDSPELPTKTLSRDAPELRTKTQLPDAQELEPTRTTDGPVFEPTRATDVVDMVPTRTAGFDERPAKSTSAAEAPASAREATDPPTPPIRRAGRAEVIAAWVAAGTIVGLAAVLGVWARGEREVRSAAEVTTVVEAAVRVPVALQKERELIDVRVATDPEGAELVDAATGAPLGRAPLTLRLRAGSTRRIRARAPGYEPTESDVGTSSSSVQVRLSPARAPVLGSPARPARAKRKTLQHDDIGEW
ncbi:MAG: protein kinase [Deltaproteobacteria bacterium]|nr:protein kinase [Deltaproteobacteria bacterium]